VPDGFGEPLRIKVSRLNELCARFRQELEETNPGIIARSWTPGYGSCAVDYHDGKLHEDLKRTGKVAGPWSNQGSVQLSQPMTGEWSEKFAAWDGKRLLPTPELQEKVELEGDLPINMQLCGEPKLEKISMEPERHIEALHLEDLMDNHPNCHIYQVHIHDGPQPSTHLRIECSDVDEKTLSGIAQLANQCLIVGKAMCENRSRGEVGEDMAKLRELKAQMKAREARGE